MTPELVAILNGPFHKLRRFIVDQSQRDQMQRDLDEMKRRVASMEAELKKPEEVKGLNGQLGWEAYQSYCVRGGNTTVPEGYRAAAIAMIDDLIERTKTRSMDIDGRAIWIGRKASDWIFVNTLKEWVRGE